MSLRSFLEKMDSRGEVLRVKRRVSTRFEAAWVMSRLAKGPVLLFENVEGFDVRIIGNVAATRGRIYSALDVSEEGFYQRMIESLRNPQPPKIVKDAPVMEVEEKPRLSKIPILTHYEKDAGPYITSAVISARDPEGKVENVSVHRLLLLDDSHLAIRLVPRHLYKLWRMAKEKRTDLDVGISIGVHPAVMLAAASSPPFGVSEYGVANALLKGELTLIRCEKVDAYVPAEAELVLEGRISHREEVPEGPLVDMTGTYDAERLQPVVEIVNVMHREDYMYQALLPGGPEHRLLMGLPREVAVYEAVSKVVPKVKAVNLSEGGCGWLHAVISLEKQTEGDAKNAIMAAFGAHGSLKHVVAVDTDIDVYNPLEVEWALATRFQGDRDLIVIRNARGSTLDPSADQESGLTTKLGFDATKPLTKPSKGFEKAEIPSTPNAELIVEELEKRVKDIH